MSGLKTLFDVNCSFDDKITESKKYYDDELEIYSEVTGYDEFDEENELDFSTEKYKKKDLFETIIDKGLNICLSVINLFGNSFDCDNIKTSLYP